MQLARSTSLPLHPRPPWLGAGSSQVLRLLCVQSLPQTDQADHLDQPPSTDAENKIIRTTFHAWSLTFFVSFVQRCLLWFQRVGSSFGDWFLWSLTKLQSGEGSLDEAILKCGKEICESFGAFFYFVVINNYFEVFTARL